jgi:hypothetical protein
MSVRVFISRAIGWLTSGADAGDDRHMQAGADVNAAGTHNIVGGATGGGAGAGGVIGAAGKGVVSGGKNAIKKVRGGLA